MQFTVVSLLLPNASSPVGKDTLPKMFRNFAFLLVPLTIYAASMESKYVTAFFTDMRIKYLVLHWTANASVAPFT